MRRRIAEHGVVVPEALHGVAIYVDGQETPALAHDVDEAGGVRLVGIGHNEVSCHLSAFLPSAPALGLRSLNISALFLE
jgi:hypothetical protein